MDASTKINTGQLTVGTTAVQIVPYNAGRKKLFINGPGNLFIGPDNTVTPSTGINIPVLTGGGAVPAVLETKAEVWGIVAAGTVAAMFLELTD